ncbi:MAG: hypothetical protein LBB45_03315 [Methanobrevibacter sp.]|jgi:hypothetical protein|nr:hypothetical protein [Candidatus Methanovirga basalitermitum]
MKTATKTLSPPKRIHEALIELLKSIDPTIQVIGGYDPKTVMSVRRLGVNVTILNPYYNNKKNRTPTDASIDLTGICDNRITGYDASIAYIVRGLSSETNLLVEELRYQVLQRFQEDPYWNTLAGNASSVLILDNDKTPILSETNSFALATTTIHIKIPPKNKREC